MSGVGSTKREKSTVCLLESEAMSSKVIGGARDEGVSDERFCWEVGGVKTHFAFGLIWLAAFALARAYTRLVRAT